MLNTRYSTSDIYDISSMVNEIQRKHMSDLSEDTLVMGMYGYLSEIFSNTIQNSIMMAAEWGNEAFPIKAKFEKTILNNAVTYNVQNLNATPAKMKVMIGFIKRELEDHMVDDVFRLDKDCKIMIGDFEYHLDYDIIITKDHIVNGVYSARYDISRVNRISDILNPYLPPPVILNQDHDDFVCIICEIRQVEIVKLYKKIISNNILENKSFDFTFDKQLATFDVTIKEDDKTVYLTPIFEGMPLEGNHKYCFYNYLDKNTIRVKFDRNSYEPKLNCDVEIEIKNTKGSEGNFSYKDKIIVSLKSNKINYRNLSMIITPITDSTNGIDRKSIKDLKEIIPKEILSRGNIINNKDLENFFNNMIDHDNKIKFYRRRDNQKERLYYAYMLIKDQDDNIIPSNTIDLDIKASDLTYHDNRYVLNPGVIVDYNAKNSKGLIVKDIKEKDIYNRENNGFLYSSPFTMVVNKDPLSISYYLTEINRDYQFKFSYINNTAMQFVSTHMHCYRNYIDGNNYKITMGLVQTMSVNKNLVQIDGNGDIVKSDIMPLLVMNINNFKYYIKGDIVKYNPAEFKYTVEFNLDTDNVINSNNEIKINNIYVGGYDNIKSHIFVNNKVNMSIYILAKFDKEENIEPNIGEVQYFMNNLDGYTLCNKYDTIEPVDLFYNYSHVIKSKVKVSKGSDDDYIFNVKGVPMIRYSYLNDVERCDNLIDYIQYRKVYIDNALNVIEDSFNVDLKFFNTYGPSRIFNIGYDGRILDKVNLTLNFRLKLYTGADKYTKDHIIAEIKNYIENINNSDINSIHMTNLTTDITNKFKHDVKFIEFIGINKYDSTYQYLEKKELNIIEQVPEFLNINLSKDLMPDINIIMV